MQLHYQSLPYQQQAISAIVDLFKGEPLTESDFCLVDNHRICANRLTLSMEDVTDNMHAIQKRHNLPLSDITKGLRFSIEMETGTGKTYVYLRTMLTLNQRYGLKKFIIVVPSVAIREGVLQALDSTKSHFGVEFDHLMYHYAVYDGKKSNQIRQFAHSSTIEILVMNIQAFEKNDNIINQQREDGRAIELLQATNPIVIIDEPQNIASDKRKAAIDSLNPLFVVDYSATHKEQYNKVYSLNPVQAFEQGLVKKIAVRQVVEDDTNGALVELKQVIGGKTLKAELVIHQNNKTGTTKKQVSVKIGDDLLTKSKKNTAYQEGFKIMGIDFENQLIELTNGQKINAGVSQNKNQDIIAKEQIRQTIIEHLNKEKRLKDKGINAKVLSLFFIDKVENYRTNQDGEKGKFFKWFVELYEEQTGQSPDGVHNGYFSQDKHGFKNTNGTTQADKDTYELIMKDKERLLSPDEPLRFIFSHSALREGWDNPNVFQICTLNETASTIKKRQEIGRGLRLAVDSTGRRMDDDEGNINELTIIPNESYEAFAKTLQQEYEADGVVFTPKINNKKDERTVSYRPDFALDPYFVAIWQKICQKARYQVNYDSDQLIKQASEAINKMDKITAPKLAIIKAQINPNQKGVTSQVVAYSKEQINAVYTIPDIFEILQNKTGLIRKTLYAILIKADRFDDLTANPQKFIDITSQLIKEQLQNLMIDGICYQKILDEPLYKQTLARYFDSYNIYKDKNTFKVEKPKKTIYNGYVDLDSHTEYEFAKDCENFDEQVVFYFKLPKQFKIPTPIGNYNPDWAVVWQDNAGNTPKQVHFVAETKNTGKSVKDGVEIEQLSKAEQQKIACAKRYFKTVTNIRYRVVQTVSELDGD